MGNVVFGYLLPEIPPKYCMPERYFVIYEADLKIGKWQKEFEKLQLTESEVGQLLFQFERMDMDESGGISFAEFVKYLRLDNNNFAGRAFDAFDHDRNGEIDFFEFCFSIWNYCTMTPGSLVSFAFGTYAKGVNGELCGKDMRVILREFYGDDYHKNTTAVTVERDFNVLLRDKFDEIRQGDFKEFCKKHPLLLWPVFRLQERLQTKILGKSFWKDVAQRRYVIGNGEFYIEIGQLQNVQLHELDRLEYIHQHTEPGLDNDEKTYGGEKGTLEADAKDADGKQVTSGRIYTKQNRGNMSGYFFTTQTYVRKAVNRDEAEIPQESFAERFHNNMKQRAYKPPKMVKKGYVAKEEDLNLSPLEKSGQGLGFSKYATPRPRVIELSKDAERNIGHGKKLAKERSTSGDIRPQSSSPTFSLSKEDLAGGKVYITDARAEGTFNPGRYAREVMGSHGRDFTASRGASRQPSQQFADDEVSLRAQLSPRGAAAQPSSRSTSRQVSARMIGTSRQVSARVTGRSASGAATHGVTGPAAGPTSPGNVSTSRQASVRELSMKDMRQPSVRNMGVGEGSPRSANSSPNSPKTSTRMPGTLSRSASKAVSIKNLTTVSTYEEDRDISLSARGGAASPQRAGKDTEGSPPAPFSKETSKKKLEREMSNFKLKTPVLRSTSTRIAVT